MLEGGTGPWGPLWRFFDKLFSRIIMNWVVLYPRTDWNRLDINSWNLERTHGHNILTPEPPWRMLIILKFSVLTIYIVRFLKIYMNFGQLDFFMKLSILLTFPKLSVFSYIKCMFSSPNPAHTLDSSPEVIINASSQTHRVGTLRQRISPPWWG